MTDSQMFINDHTFAAMTPAQLALSQKAAAYVSTLLGPAPAGGHAVGKGGRGPCRICGVTTQLTFEHVPPRSAGNNQPRRGVDLTTDLQSAPGVMPRSGWIQQQRGAGAYATCASCNSLGGQLYVPAYSDAVSAACHALREFIGTLPEDDDSGPPESIKFSTHGSFFPGAVVRQALFMLMAMSGSAGLGEAFPILRRIVLEGVTHELPEEIRLRLSLMITNRIRIHPVGAQVDVVSMQYRVLLETAHLPFAWLAEIGPESSHPSPDVSWWTNFGSTEEADVELRLPVGSIATAIPADYRHPWQVPAEDTAAGT